jgi:hypothetical protein
MLHEDDILNEARAQRVLNDKDIIRGYSDSCKSDDDDQPPAFFGGHVTLGQQDSFMECALSDFSTMFIVLVPQHRSQILAEGLLYVPAVPLKKKPRSLKASVRKARKFIPVWVSHEIKGVKRFAWSVLVEGGRSEQPRRICLWNNIFVSPKWKFYQALSDVSEKLLSQARQSSTKWAEKIEPDTTFSFGANWSQRRQANHCFCAFMDCKQHKFVDFELTSGSLGRQKKFIGNFEGASKTIEACILRQLVDRWHGREEKTLFVHDQDATASTILVERGWKLDEYFDRNHAVK